MVDCEEKKNCVELTVLKVVRKQDQFHDGQEREMLITKQELFFDENYNVARYQIMKEEDKICERSAPRTINLTKFKLIKFINTMNDMKRSCMVIPSSTKT